MQIHPSGAHVLHKLCITESICILAKESQSIELEALNRVWICVIFPPRGSNWPKWPGKLKIANDWAPHFGREFCCVLADRYTQALMGRHARSVRSRCHPAAVPGALPPAHGHDAGYIHPQRLQCSSFLVMTYFGLRDYNILPKKELHWRLWVYTSSFVVTCFCGGLVPWGLFPQASPCWVSCCCTLEMDCCKARSRARPAPSCAGGDPSSSGRVYIYICIYICIYIYVCMYMYICI